jgi:hypothetical protein
MRFASDLKAGAQRASKVEASAPSRRRQRRDRPRCSWRMNARAASRQARSTCGSLGASAASVSSGL